MDPFEVFACWDWKENQPQLALTLTLPTLCRTARNKALLVTAYEGGDRRR